ncbi:serine hydrolase [Streptomyces sp. NPDC026672]|uniref:serine hydrolase n=1 Tax=unclassified Streptomyces TaxID=2593676 RepID=UPI0033C17E9A
MESSGGGRPLVHALVAAVAVVGVTAAGSVYVQARAHSGPAPVSSASSLPPSPSPSSRSTAAPSSVPSVSAPAAAREEEPVDPDELLHKGMADVDVPSGARVSVAVLDLGSGARAGYGTGTFDTASIVKVDILAALLLRAQDADRRLTAAERAYATRMIESSDNDAASALWRDIGGAAGLDAANRRFGLMDTTGGDGGLWGLTRTTAADQLTLLRQVFEDDSKLSAASRAYLRGLMENVVAGQRWGVSAVPGGSSGWALKNGWLPRSTTGLWDVNSIGRVTSAGRSYLLAVLTDGTSTQERGITLAESAARAAVAALAAG